MKIQPLDADSDDLAVHGGRSCFGKLFERRKEAEAEPSSVCLAKMVRNFLEETNERPSRCGRSLCRCFGDGEGEDGEDREVGCEVDVHLIKSMVPCQSKVERSLLVHAAKLVEKNKHKERNNFHSLRSIVSNGLLSLGYDASICTSKWENSSFPAGEHKYIDVLVRGERIIIDIDFKSEFEIPRLTKAYKLVLQSLPSIFVGKADRLQRLLTVVCEAMKLSLKTGGLHVAPWRRAEYMKCKWFSTYERTNPPLKQEANRPVDQRLDKSGDRVAAKQNGL